MPKWTQIRPRLLYSQLIIRHTATVETEGPYDLGLNFVFNPTFLYKSSLSIYIPFRDLALPPITSKPRGSRRQ